MLDSQETYKAGKDEPILKTLLRGNGLVVPQVLATVTLNRYNASILNTNKMWIADIDKPPYIYVEGYFQTIKNDYKNLRYDLRDVMSFRVYKTCGGYRLLLTSEIMLVNKFAIQLLEHFNSDPNYIKMCQVQNCYRARLSPKPWRMGLKNDQRADYTSSNQRVCKFLGTLGTGYIHPHLTKLVHYHDEQTRAIVNSNNYIFV